MQRFLLPALLFLTLSSSLLHADEPQSPQSITYTVAEGVSFKMIKIPGENYSIGETEVTQEVYEAVTEENPAYFTGENMPVDSVNWYDCIVFCNKLSVLLGKTPVYSVDGNTDCDDWDYSPHSGASVTGKVETNPKADGFRLPTVREWKTAAKCGRDYIYSGSSTPDETAWYSKNSGWTPHETAQKEPNEWGLYDMSGNLWEWCEDKYKADSDDFRIKKGGCYSSDRDLCKITFTGHHYGSRYQPCYSYYTFGFRISAGE
ncbi:MAG: SUMF1/EgtB/PvdO family nonheme iron enzyme [Treponema sp.]|nr:SUMF1/EgtB/PvdO family nonheme iron enzyme [Treponema sp.]